MTTVCGQVVPITGPPEMVLFRSIKFGYLRMDARCREKFEMHHGIAPSPAPIPVLHTWVGRNFVLRLNDDNTMTTVVLKTIVVGKEVFRPGTVVKFVGPHTTRAAESVFNRLEGEGYIARLADSHHI